MTREDLQVSLMGTIQGLILTDEQSADYEVSLSEDEFFFALKNMHNIHKAMIL